MSVKGNVILATPVKNSLNFATPPRRGIFTSSVQVLVRFTFFMFKEGWIPTGMT